jgi:hypothetical protein
MKSQVDTTFTSRSFAKLDHHWAFASLLRSPGCRAHYDRRRTRGEQYAAALRNLTHRLLGYLHHCLLTEQTYREDIAFPHQDPDETIPVPPAGRTQTAARLPGVRSARRPPDS